MIISYYCGERERSSEELNENVYQVSFDGTIGEKGSGMGLNLCKYFIKQYNGNLEIESDLGKGSKIKVSLPA